MSQHKDHDENGRGLSRRALMAGSAGRAALGTARAARENRGAAWPAAAIGSSALRNAPVAPFDSFRDYIEAIEAWGLVVRVPRMDQDHYEITAMMYRLIDEFGWYEAPAILVEEVRIDGQWIRGPVICNHQGHWYTEAIVFGVQPVPNDGRQTYRNAMAHLRNLLVDGEYPRIPPVEVERASAPCKEIVLTGDDIDLTKYAFIQSNPADSGRYINTGSTFTDDPVIGKNFGTYRCELRGPRLIGINPEPNQTAWRTFMAAKERGDKTVRISIVVGQDPVTWMISGSRIVNRLSKEKVDELAIAGGMRGKAIEVVRSETNEHMIPAHAEMIIEGEVPLDTMMPEGPFGEMYQYLGSRRPENFIVNVTAVTHRKNPWILNQFTGVTRGYVTGPTAVLFNESLRRLVPGMIEIHSPVDTTGLTYVKIKKTKPGEGIEVGRKLARIIPIYKIIVVVDDDVDILDSKQVNMAIGSRWQPGSASLILEGLRGMPLDPSIDRDGKTSKIVIDATIQWPEEGGPETFAELNRTLLEKMAPESFERVDRKWGAVVTRKLTTF
ncbi:MAG: UbiD family decarboxylase domain-containing protein [Gammaproteobacteria bacterium]